MGINYVAKGAKMRCKFGDQESILNPKDRHMLIDGLPQACKMDYEPNKNIPPFGTCTCTGNPAVQASRQKRAPCKPVIKMQWANPKRSVMVDGIPTLMKNSILTCKYGGIIRIIDSGCDSSQDGAQAQDEILAMLAAEKAASRTKIREAKKNYQPASAKNSKTTNNKSDEFKEDPHNDIYVAKFVNANASAFEIGEGDPNSTLALSGSSSDVVIENARTNDSFSFTIFTYVKEAGYVGITLPSIGTGVTEIYGKFPKEMSDFLQNTEHRSEIIKTIVGDANVKFVNAIFGSYAIVEMEKWRGKCIGVGLWGKPSIGYGKRIEYTLKRVTRLKLVSGQQIKNERRNQFDNWIQTANSSGMSNVYGKFDSEKEWPKYRTEVKKDIEEKYREAWGIK